MKTVKEKSILSLTGKKIKETEGLYKGFFRTELYRDGILKMTFPASITQPHKNSKSIVINCFIYNLEWL